MKNALTTMETRTINYSNIFQERNAIPIAFNKIVLSEDIQDMNFSPASNQIEDPLSNIDEEASTSQES